MTKEYASDNDEETGTAGGGGFTLPSLDMSKCCNTRGKKRAWCGVVTVAFIIVIGVLAASLKKLSSTEYGAEYNVHKKILDEAVKTGGLHIGPPGYEFVKFPSTFITVDLNDRTCVSQDGLLVDFDVTFQYQVPKENLLYIIRKYRNFDKWAQVVEAAGSSAVQHACSEFTISNFQNKRGIIQSTMEDNLRLKLEGSSAQQAVVPVIDLKDESNNEGNDEIVTTTVVQEQQVASEQENEEQNKKDVGVYARAISLQLRNVDLPRAYQNAVSEKQSAQEGIALAKNQRKQNVTKAETELKTSMEQARKIRDTAMNDANITLTQAQLKAEETTFAFATEADVIVRVKESLGLTTDGVLAYLSNQLYASVKDLQVSVAEPAKVSRQEELSSVSSATQPEL